MKGKKMKVTRKGVFETNSSSTHSICIAKGKSDVLDLIPCDENGVCRIYPGEFGWEVATYNDAATKASYCLTHLMSGKNKENGFELSAKEVMRREALLAKVIREECGAKRVDFVRSSDKYHPWGYIDHQSIEQDGGAREPAFKNAKTLKAFIFNPKSTLHTDNDNG